ncbi:hypothetical protein RJ639_039384, partial [Escallonia herrerae]
MESWSKRLIMFSIVAAATVAVATTTMAEDEKDCADQLTNLASCIPYVSGTAKKPTPECCEDTKKVRSAKPKCLCVLIKESTDPSMGLPINTTLAIQMPSACNIDAKVSDCPSILNLPPGSPDAKIFKEADASSSTNTATPSTTTSPASSSSSSSSGSSTSSSDSKKTTSGNSNAGAKSATGGLFVMTGLASIIASIL